MARSSVHRDAVLLQLLFRSRIIRRERERERNSYKRYRIIVALSV